MSESCVYAPKKGVKTFYSLQKEFGYDMAWKIYGIGMNPKFKNDYKDSLSLDAEGVPTVDSLLSNEVIVGFLGNRISKLLESKYKPREDTVENYYLALEDAKKFNKESPYNKYFTATIGYDTDSKLHLIYNRKSGSADKKFSEQYSVAILNRKLSNILSPLGVTVGLLNNIEQNSGRVGVTDFTVAKDIANNSVSMIRVANNMEGAKALSEEFSHLVIGAMRDQPLIRRNIDNLANEDTLKLILGDNYQDVYNFYSGNLQLVAEEALGHILQSKLLEKAEGSNLTDRLIKFIQNKFKNISEDSITKAVIEAENIMSDIASNVLNNTLQLSKKDIIGSQRDVQFNALSDRVARNIDILKEAINTEAKRLKIAADNDNTKDYIRGTIKKLDISIANADTTLGIMIYADEALKSLKYASNQLNELSISSSKDKFKILRGIKSSIQSYSRFIDDLNDLALDEENEEGNDFVRDITIVDDNGNTKIVTVKDTLKGLNNLYKSVSRSYLKVVIPSFAEFLRPILGDEITLELGKDAGKKVNIEELLTKSESDITFLDRWLDSMGNSSDILLRAFDKVYKQAMDKARLKSIKDFRRIQALRMKAESMGITNYDWLFEKYDDGSLTGNYISEVNYSQYQKDVYKMEERLNSKYGKNPKGESLEAKKREREDWYDSHTILSALGKRIPNKSYNNGAFNSLTAVQKEIREEFLKLKEEFDNQYPPNRVNKLKAIQLRKDGVQRFIDSSKSPSSIWSNIKEHLGEEFLDRADDDTMFGDTTRGGLIDFAGKEFMTLPVLFTNRLENPDELSTDIFGSLMAYTLASNNYKELDNIIDPLEVGRSVVTDYRKVKSTRGGLNLVEKFNVLGTQFQNDILEGNGSNIEKRLDDFFASQIYHKYLKDSGVINVLGTKLNKNKLVSWIMRGSSLAQLGFNYLTNLSNVVTGVAMQNIEAASRQYFNVKELAKADRIYAKLIGSNIAEFNSRNKTNKLSLFNELFDIRNDFDNITHNSMRKSPLARIFSSEIAYLGQSAGDHWLYLRTAIAMSLREKVNVPNKGTMSLWDALRVINSFGNNNKIKEMILPEGTTDSNGNLFDIGKFSRKIAHVNQSLFGIYNTDDRNAAQRVILGRLLLQYRNWMKPQFNRRFQKAQLNLDTGDVEEGYYRTSFRILAGLLRGQYQLGSILKNLSDNEKFNVRRAITEMVQLCAVVILAEFIEWPDDRNRPWALKLAEYSSRRLEHELGTLAPSPIMLQEMLKTVKSPAASITQVQNLVNLFTSLMDPRDWSNEIESGKYEGLSTLERNLLRSGLPVVSQYNQLQRLIYDIDNSINYYARP